MADVQTGLEIDWMACELIESVPGKVSGTPVVRGTHPARCRLSVVELEGLRVPELWAREVANRLAMAYRRKRITSDDERAFLTALSHLVIEVEEAASAAAVIRDGTAAAARYGLTAYDAAYVDLALREGMVLATLDTAMRKAAEQSGVTVFRQL